MKTYVVSENITFSRKTSLILLMSDFFCQKDCLYSKEFYESWFRDFLLPSSVFIREKVTAFENISFTDYASRIRLPYFSKLNRKLKHDNRVTFWRHGVKSNFIDVAMFCLSSVVSVLGFLWILLLILELWQSFFVKDWPEGKNQK